MPMNRRKRPFAALMARFSGSWRDTSVARVWRLGRIKPYPNSVVASWRPSVNVDAAERRSATPHLAPGSALRVSELSIQPQR